MVANRKLARIGSAGITVAVGTEDGQWSETKLGTPQGAVASPLLANVSATQLFLLGALQANARQHCYRRPYPVRPMPLRQTLRANSYRLILGDSDFFDHLASILVLSQSAKL